MGIGRINHSCTYLRMIALALSLYAYPVQAIDFFVDTVNDEAEILPGDGICDVGAGVCTLRAAIQEVNQAPGATYNIYLSTNTYVLDLNGTDDTAELGDLDIDSAGSTILISAQSGLSASDVLIQRGVSFTDRLFHVIGATSITFRNVTIQNASTTVNGGAIYNVSGASLTFDSVVLNNNVTSAGNGGGAIFSNNGAISISDSTFSNNQTTTGWGGAIYNASSSTLSISSTTFSGNSSNSAGGAIYHANTTANSLSVSDSTFQNNSSSTAGGGLYNAGGAMVTGSLFYQNSAPVNGATFGGGGIANSSTLTIKNTTISGNQAQAYGGGIHNGNSATANLTLNNVTVTGNTADLDSNSVGDGGGLYADTSTTVNYSNTIIANNTDGSGEAPDCGGVSITSQGYNLIGIVGTCTIGGPQTGDLTGPASLVALADNGGPTLTHALDVSSIAIDAGNQNTPDGIAPNCESSDQRGYSRPVDGDNDAFSYCDIGAYELGATSGLTFSGGGCYIATAAYGTEMEKDVVTLRSFRDNYLMTNKPGKLFTELYYKLSPPVATKISTSETLREWARASLIPLVSLGRLLDETDAKTN